MLGALAALILPLAGATQLSVQIQSGGVTFIPAAHVHSIRITAGHGGAALHARSFRGGKKLKIVVSGRSGVMPPFVQGAAPPNAYEVVYPEEMRLEAYDAGGQISIVGERAGATLETQSGPITATGIRGALDAVADEGDVTVTLADGWNGPSLRMQSGRGALRVTVPRALRARVFASTAAGRVYNSLPRGGTSAETPVITLFTQKGDVYLNASP